MIHRFHTAESQRGFTLPELVVVVAVIGAITTLGVTAFSTWSNDRKVGMVSRTVSNALTLARTEAIRTGNVHIVFLAIGPGGGGDVAGNPLQDSMGNPVPLLILDDGLQGSAGQNCQIDAGEATQTIDAVPGINWGFSISGGVKAPGDGSPSPTGTGSSFTSPAGFNTTWVAFLASGMPSGFGAGCALGDLGTGNGAIYLTNGVRDYSIVLNPLGGTRVHAWDGANVRWRN